VRASCSCFLAPDFHTLSNRFSWQRHALPPASRRSAPLSSPLLLAVLFLLCYASFYTQFRTLTRQVSSPISLRPNGFLSWFARYDYDSPCILPSLSGHAPDCRGVDISPAHQGQMQVLANGSTHSSGASFDPPQSTRASTHSFTPNLVSEFLFQAGMLARRLQRRCLL